MLPSEQYRQPEAGAVLAALHEINVAHGYLPGDEVRKAAEELGVPLSQVFSAATFYAIFSFTPPGRHTIQLCEGTACYVKGATALLERLEEELGIEPDETTADLLFTLKRVKCVGSCGVAPVIRVGVETFGRLTPDDLNNMLSRFQDEAKGGEYDG
jgi:NADH:ubiquinone oxidoreductase subunit E